MKFKLEIELKTGELTYPEISKAIQKSLALYHDAVAVGEMPLIEDVGTILSYGIGTTPIGKWEITADAPNNATLTAVKSVDQFKNVAYLRKNNHEWRCTLANGTPASLWYAGLGEDHTGVQILLKSAETVEQALAIVRQIGRNTYTAV